jgi:DNA-binding CsgD family transcriptional regulator
MNYLDNLHLDSEIKLILNEKIHQFLSLSDYLPVFVIHELITEEIKVIYMSPKGLEGIGITLNEVQEMGRKYHELFFNNEDVEEYLSKWILFANDYSNKNAWYTFFQQVNIKKCEKPVWFLTASTVILYDEESKVPLYSLALPLLLNQNLPIISKLEKILHENNFIKKHLSAFTSLTNKEKEILKEIGSGKNPKEIAKKLFSAEHTIRTHRRNIKKKLNIYNDAELSYFAHAFNLL